MAAHKYDVTISLATMWADVRVLRDTSCSVKGELEEWLQSCKEIKADHRQVTGMDSQDVITDLNFTSIYHYSHRISAQDLQQLVCIFVLSLCI